MLYRAYSLGRERCRSFVKATQGRTTLRTVDVSVFATLRSTRPPPCAPHLPSSAFPHSLCAPSVARSKSGSRHCYAEPRHYLCGVGYALRLAANSLPNSHRFTLSPLYRGHSLGRERCRSFVKATQGRTTLRTVDVPVFATLRPTRPPPCAPHLPSSAFPHSLCAPSVARSKSGSRHCYAEPRHYLCGVGYALRLVCSWLLLGRRRLSLPAVALPLSSSLASPPPSLRSGTSPQGDLYVLWVLCVPPLRHACGSAFASARTKSGWVRFIAVSASPSAGRSANM